MQRSERSKLPVVAGTSAVLVVLIVILYPEPIFQSSLEGLHIWWKFIFPALLPFLILSRLLIDFGVIRRLGDLLDPLMRTLFRLPGIGGWALAAGSVAGAPAAADIIGRLMKHDLLSDDEAERLIIVCHSVNPVIMIHVIAYGFYGDAQLGWFLVAVHLLTLVLIGLILRGARKRHQADYGYDPVLRNRQPVSIGTTLGDAVADSTLAIMKVGGTIIMFSVLVQSVKQLFLVVPGQWIGGQANSETADALTAGVSAIFELHLGAYRLHPYLADHPVILAAALCAVMSWGGLSSHMQSWSFIPRGRVRYHRFVLYRMFHAVLAAGAALVLWLPYRAWIDLTARGTQSVPAVADAIRGFPAPAGWLWMSTAIVTLIVLGAAGSFWLRRRPFRRS